MTVTAFEDLTEVVAVEYLRVSVDKSGRMRSNEEQHDENVPAAERRGWSLGEPYSDLGSASKFKTKRRPGFDRLAADMTAGTFPGRVLIVWEASRLSRDMGEWALFLTACEKHGVRIYVTQDGDLFDPSIARHFKALMEMALDAEVESRKTSARVKRTKGADRANGTRVGGGKRPFGFEPNGVDVRDAEATIVRECVAAILAGQSPRSIAADLNERGVPTAQGNTWHPSALTRVLTSGRIAGRLTHDGDDAGEAPWPALIDEVTRKRLLATLGARSQVGRRGRTPWLLTGLLRCERCGASLVSQTTTGGKRKYRCAKGPGWHGCGALVIAAEPLEELLGKAAQARLVDVDARRGAAATEADDGEDLAELGRIAAMRIEDAADLRATVISRATANARAAEYDAREREVEASIAAKVSAVTPLAFVLAEGFVGRAWDDIENVEEQRRLLDALIDHVVVAPATTRGSTTFEPGRVRALWK